MILGVTGNIASGKSTVAAEFVRLGAVLVDADQLARDVVAPGSEVLQQLVERFGATILHADGSLKRAQLSQIIFADDQARMDLNRITHPAIARLAVERLQQLKNAPGVPLVIYEAPLLFEAGAESRVDQILVVKIDPVVQLQRLRQRDGLDKDEAKRRIAAQMPQVEKVGLADWLIDNSGSLEDLRGQVVALWQKLTK